MNQYQDTLIAEKKALEEELADVAILNTETNQWEAIPDQEMLGEVDENDAADRFEDFEERTSKVTTLQGRLNDVAHALDRIEKKTFGTCEVGNDHRIEEARLAANPAARTCMKHMNA